jgi:hypothetical protein
MYGQSRTDTWTALVFFGLAVLGALGAAAARYPRFVR